MRIIITGEPGSGKTMLAIALYYFLGKLGFAPEVTDDWDFTQKLNTAYPHEDALRAIAEREKAVDIYVVSGPRVEGRTPAETTVGFVGLKMDADAVARSFARHNPNLVREAREVFTALAERGSPTAGLVIEAFGRMSGTERHLGETIEKYRCSGCNKEITAPVDMVHEEVYCSATCLDDAKATKTTIPVKSIELRPSERTINQHVGPTVMSGTRAERDGHCDACASSLTNRPQDLCTCACAACVEQSVHDRRVKKST